MKIKKFISILLILLVVPIFFTSCQKLKDFHDPPDLSKEPLDPDKRAQRNIKEGRGINLGGITNRKTTYEFSTANPMWRASLEVLDFIPLTTVDYSGGMIITDWYSETDGTSNESLKITVRFLSNEIRADSLKIVIHKKRCSANNSCKMSLLPADSQIKSELRSVILRKASLIEKASKGKKSNKKN
tara:strand:- start:2326 stop:2883 length:558 start_codon:yes stop_codon:yes gene_type:complete